ncbi:hypothetical protein [Glaesserella parasuis]|uniref:Uncharacterized protein n=1 Tax=Glaesserella parasuis TaxID=738 RepID=A0A1T0AB71_GLAPU|nr:hypothetical protein [Glaesserella parasuis]ATW45491.1 hypothetical protein A2U21_05880 [Glaesserella parasuis str. Nagasaki]EQA03275.1 hypothetical protein HPSNAG_0541 [Glaesserella parasuis str. Nagasaki]EYE73260.1 hypothetical protein HPNK_00055 [Glaesserella parasuis str. Nagasaki]MDG6334187.1 hypothetical protein [Glaesserella parasuis]MDG6369870.1 hypothetical protein [Glaesserella parasuis]
MYGNDIDTDIAIYCGEYDSDEAYFKIEANIEKWLREQGFDVLCDHLVGTTAWEKAIEAQLQSDLERKEEKTWDIY